MLPKLIVWEDGAFPNCQAGFKTAARLILWNMVDDSPADRPAEKMASWPVSDRLGNLRSNDAQLLEAPEPSAPGLFPAN
jgi:hypothetical protein